MIKNAADECHLEKGSMLEDKKILFVLKCVVVALLFVLAVLTMTFNWSICHDGIQDIVSGRFSSE